MDIFVLISVFKLLIRYPDLLIASASFAVAIILGICQVRQATRVKAFERRLGALGGIYGYHLVYGKLQFAKPQRSYNH